MLDRKNKPKKNFRMEKGSILEKGYGIIPKLIMQDKRLSIEAKSIYSYLCSYAGAGNEAYPTVARIMNDLHISKNRFYKHMDMLVDNGYVIKHRDTENNLLSNNIYELVSSVDNSGVSEIDKIWENSF